MGELEPFERAVRPSTHFFWFQSKKGMHLSYLILLFIIFNQLFPQCQVLIYHSLLNFQYFYNLIQHFQQDFIDLGRIGQGGFANVHKVQSKLDNRLYALKIIQIKPSECKNNCIETILKLLSEVCIMSGLNHKNIIEYHGCWIESEMADQNQKEHWNEVQTEHQEADEEIVMVMEEQFSSNSIEFKYEDLSKGKRQKIDHRNHDTNGRINENQVKINATPTSTFPSADQNYKSIKIFILSELAESNLLSYLYQRSLRRKNGFINNKKNLQTSNAGNSITRKDSASIVSEKEETIENYKMILQIIDGLEYLHSKKVIHRDLKLHNIVIDSKKKCKIIDYGLAKKTRLLRSTSEYPKNVEVTKKLSMNDESGVLNELDEIFSSSVGTKIYSSPEQINSQKYDHRTDIFSLAIIILLFFCDFTTSHQQLQTIDKIRKNHISFINCDQRLKLIMSRCLSQEKQRPALSQIKTVVKSLIRETYQIHSKNLTQNSLSNKNAIQREQDICILENEKLKRKLSKSGYCLRNSQSETTSSLASSYSPHSQIEKFSQILVASNHTVSEN